jgi:hypothetical protein
MSPNRENRQMGSTNETAYIQASGSRTQVLKAASTPERVVIDSTDEANGIENINEGEFKVADDGAFFVMAAPQVGRKATGPLANLRCWIEVNGSNVPNSDVLLDLASSAVKDVIVCQGILVLESGDVVTVMAETNSTDAGVALEAIHPSPTEPLVPSIIFTMFKL